MKKFNHYEYAKNFLFDKDKYLSNYLNSMLCKCYSMFEYKNLPGELKKEYIEKYLLLNGHCIFTKVNNSFYVFDGSFTGSEDAYHNLNKYIVVNNALNLNKEFDLEKNTDAVLIANNSEKTPMINELYKYGVLLNECEISLNLVSILNRLPYLITSADDKTKANCELFLTKIKNGDFSIIADNAFIESIKALPLTTQNNSQINNLLELTQYIKASSYNAIGLNANWNAKRERLNTNEINLNADALTPTISNMLFIRQQALKEINIKYSLNIDVKLSNIWAQKEQEIKTTIADLKDKELTNEITKKEVEEKNV